MEKKCTINDIAQLCNVSRSTVSHYLNEEYQYMSLQTRERIQAAIAKSNYVPRKSVLRRSKPQQMIGVIVPDLLAQSLSQYLMGLSTVLEENGYNMLLFNSHNSPKTEREEIHVCMKLHVDGLIIRPCLQDTSYYEKLLNERVPMVISDCFLPNWKHSMVYIDNYGIIQKAMKHLINNNYRQIYWLGNKSTIRNSKQIDRKRSFDSFCAGQKLPLSPIQVQYVECARPVQHQQMHQAINAIREEKTEHHKAILCDGASVFREVISELQLSRVSVPYEVGVCGFDFSGAMHLISPGLTHITLPYGEMAKASAEMLMRILQEKAEPEDCQRRFDAHLVQLASTMLY